MVKLFSKIYSCSGSKKCREKQTSRKLQHPVPLNFYKKRSERDKKFSWMFILDSCTNLIRVESKVKVKVIWLIFFTVTSQSILTTSCINKVLYNQFFQSNKDVNGLFKRTSMYVQRKACIPSHLHKHTLSCGHPFSLQQIFFHDKCANFSEYC